MFVAFTDVLTNDYSGSVPPWTNVVVFTNCHSFQPTLNHNSIAFLAHGAHSWGGTVRAYVDNCSANNVGTGFPLDFSLRSRGFPLYTSNTYVGVVSSWGTGFSNANVVKSGTGFTIRTTNAFYSNLKVQDATTSFVMDGLTARTNRFAYITLGKLGVNPMNGFWAETNQSYSVSNSTFTGTGNAYYGAPAAYSTNHILGADYNNFSLDTYGITYGYYTTDFAQWKIDHPTWDQNSTTNTGTVTPFLVRSVAPTEVPGLTDGYGSNIVSWSQLGGGGSSINTNVPIAFANLGASNFNFYNATGNIVAASVEGSNATFAGTVSAAAFVGSGAGLKNLSVPQTYFVATNGSDSNDGSVANPFLRITNSLLKMKSGDTLTIRAGVYSEHIENTIPAGYGWEQPTTIRAYSGEIVTLNGQTSDLRDLIRIEGSEKHHILLDGLTLDGTNLVTGGNTLKITYSVAGQPAHHIRVKDCVIKNCYNGQNVLITAGADAVPTYCEFTNCTVFGAGLHSDFVNQEHGLYIATASNTFEACTVYSNLNLGFHFYGNYPNYNTVKGCTFAGTSTRLADCAAIGTFTATNNVFENNIFYDCGYGIVCNSGYTGGVSAVIANNTFYSNSYPIYIVAGGANVSDNLIAASDVTNSFAIWIDTGPTTNSLIVVSNNAIEGVVGGSSGTIYDPGHAAILSGNLTNQTSVGIIDGAARNFALSSTSVAVAAGVRLQGIVSDFWGRSMFSPTDIGAVQNYYRFAPQYSNAYNGSFTGNGVWLTNIPNSALQFTAATNGVALTNNEGRNVTLAGGLLLTNTTLTTKPLVVNAGASLNALVVHTNGNVGVGTVNPTGKFYVAVTDGDASSPANAAIFSGASRYVAIGVNSSSYAWIQSYSTPLFINYLGNNTIINRDAGNVGIGTDVPQAQLHVVGNGSTDLGRFGTAAGVVAMLVKTNVVTVKSIGSLAVDTIANPGSTGWTNTFLGNAVVYLNGVTLTATVYNNAGIAVRTNASLTGLQTIILQPLGSVTYTGTLTDGTAVPF
jgi:hypothetical protein